MAAPTGAYFEWSPLVGNGNWKFAYTTGGGTTVNYIDTGVAVVSAVSTYINFQIDVAADGSIVASINGVQVATVSAANAPAADAYSVGHETYTTSDARGTTSTACNDVDYLELFVTTTGTTSPRS